MVGLGCLGRFGPSGSLNLPASPPPPHTAPFPHFTLRPPPPRSLRPSPVNGVGVEGMQELSLALQAARAIVALNVRGNDVGEVGATALAAAVARAPSLTSLNAAGCKFGDVGAGVLAQAIKACPSLAALDLSSE